MTKKSRGTSIHAIRAVKRVMSDGQERTLAEIAEAIHDLPQPKTSRTVRQSQVPTPTEMGQIGKKLGFTVTRQTRYYDGIVDGERVLLPKRVAVYRK